MNALGQCLTRLFYVSVFKLPFKQKDKHIKNHHAEYPTFHLMTWSCILSLNCTILFSLCLTLQNTPYPLWEAKTAGRAGCPTKLCSRRGCKERHNLFKKVFAVAAVQGRQKKPLVGENLTCLRKVLGLCMRRKLFSQKRSKHCLTNMLKVVKKPIGWGYFLWEKNPFLHLRNKDMQAVEPGPWFQMASTTLF